jgi:hypothetical protein
MNKQKDTEKRNKALTILLIIIWFLSATTLIYLNFGRMGAPKDTLPNNNKIHFKSDENAAQGDLTKSKTDVIAALNQKVQDGSINISMNTNPVFQDGKSKGTLMITNSTVNKYPQQVEIYTKDGHKLIYSGGVEVGSKVETSTLLVNLPKGTYDCVAYFNAVDPKTGDRVGTAGANIKITVLS